MLMCVSGSAQVCLYYTLELLQAEVLSRCTWSDNALRAPVWLFTVVVFV